MSIRVITLNFISTHTSNITQHLVCVSEPAIYYQCSLTPPEAGFICWQWQVDSVKIWPLLELLLSVSGVNALNPPRVRVAAVCPVPGGVDHGEPWGF